MQHDLCKLFNDPINKWVCFFKSLISFHCHSYFIPRFGNEEALFHVIHHIEPSPVLLPMYYLDKRALS